MSKKKLLSIYIPTYNRGKLLELMLIHLLPQIEEVKDDVELVISNNGSEDDTEEIIKKYMCSYEIKYNKNSNNIGGFKNYMLVSKLCSAEYSLILGDDDLLIEGKLPMLIEILKSNRDLDYFFLNFDLITIKERNEIIQNNKKHILLQKNCFSSDFQNKEIDKWESLYKIKNKYPSTMFAYLGANLFRTSIWEEYSNILNINENKKLIREMNNEKFCISLDYIFPHIKIAATAMKGKKCYYIGDPVIAQGFGAQIFWSDWDIINILTINELFEYYKEIGVDLQEIEPFIKDCMINNGKYIAKILSNTSKEELKKININNYMKSFSKNNLFIKTFINEIRKYTINFDQKIYNEYSSDFFEGIIGDYINRDKKIVLWGTGEISNALIRKSKRIRKCITMVVDGNIHNHGKNYNELNVDIMNPQILTENPVDLIIIGSVKFEKEIIKEIKKMKLNCDIIYSRGILRK